MSAIAGSAGVSRQALYLHFEGRGALLLALSEQVDHEVRSGRQGRIDDAPDAVEALRELVRVQGQIKPGIHAIASAIDRLRATDPDADSAWQAREQARLDRTRKVVDRLDREGRLRPGWKARDAAELVWSMTSLRAWQELTVDRRWSTRRWVDHTTAVLEAALVR